MGAFRTISLALALVAIGGLTACSPYRTERSTTQTDSLPQPTLGTTTYRAVERLLGIANPPVASGSKLVIATIVDIDNLEESSTLGRMMSDYAASRAIQLGFAVDEHRLRETLAIRPETGELILSRDLSQIPGLADGQAVIAGTYAAGKSWIYVNLRLIGLVDQRTLSSVDFVVPRDADLTTFLADAYEAF